MFGEPLLAVLALELGGCAGGCCFELVRHELGEVGLGCFG